jgi:hypothetical protein
MYEITLLYSSLKTSYLTRPVIRICAGNKLLKPTRIVSVTIHALFWTGDRLKILFHRQNKFFLDFFIFRC